MALLPEFLEETCCLANEQEFVATQQAKQVAYPPKVTLPHREVTQSDPIPGQEAAQAAAAAAQAQKPAQTAVPAQKTQAQLTGHQAALAALAAAAAALLEVNYPL